MTILLREKEFNPWAEIESYQQSHLTLNGKYGATSVFVGTMRDLNQGDSVKSMYLEHYPGMTEKELQRIAEQAENQWPLLSTLIIHRIGPITPNDTIVLVASWAAHRTDAFAASRFIMEALKTRAPFWKKETLASNQVRWVKNNHPPLLKT